MEGITHKNAVSGERSLSRLAELCQIKVLVILKRGIDFDICHIVQEESLIFLGQLCLMDFTGSVSKSFDGVV